MIIRQKTKQDHPLVVIVFVLGILFVSCQRHESAKTARFELQKECDRLESIGEYGQRARLGCLDSVYKIGEEGRPDWLETGIRSAF